MFKNTKKVFALILAIAVVAMSMFTGVVVSAADPAETAEGTIDLLEFGTYLTEAGSTSQYYDTVVADNGETGADWDNAIIIDNAEELVYLCKGSGDETKGLYYKVADGIAGFDLSKGDIDLDGTLADNIDKIKAGGKNHSGDTPGFQGHFDGNGTTVYGAHVNAAPTYIGLFGCTKGDVTIKNINVNKAYFAATAAAGGIVGYHAGDGTQTLTIENCSITDSHIEYVGEGNFGHGIGAILGYSNNLSSWKESDKGVDGNGDGDMGDIIYVNGGVNIKNCYVNLDEEHFISCLKTGDADVRGCHGGIAGFINTNAMSVSDCVVIGVTPYATSASTGYNDVQHSGLESHFTNVYTTQDVAITGVYLGGTLTNRNFTGKVFPLTDAQLKGAAAVENMDLDWTVWMADSEGYPELANAHKNITLVDNENGTHTATCDCGFGGIASEHTYVDDTCACGAELNCSTRKTIYWDGTVASGIATGTGTEADPYIIKTAAEFAWLVRESDVDGNGKHNSTGKYYEIDESIGKIVLQPAAEAEAILALQDAAAVKAYFETGSHVEWIEGGWETQSFAGNFDGNGATVYGLYSVSAANAGLFNTIDGGAAIKNIALKNSYLTSTAANYQVGGIAAVTSSAVYGGKIDGAIWFEGCVVANNYMYNSSTETNRSGVVIGASNDVVYMDNCLVYGNDATYGESVNMAVLSGGNNSVIVSDSFVAPEGLELVDDGAETARYYNMIRNSIIFGTKPYNTAKGKGSRFNDPKCYENVLTDADVATDTFGTTDAVLGTTEEQIKTVAVADLATAELGDAWLNTASYPELKSFHDEVFTGAPSAADNYAGHVSACSCGLEAGFEEHEYEVDDPSLGMAATYQCIVCDFVCDHMSMDHVEMTQWDADCVNDGGYTGVCDCGFTMTETFGDCTGHNFTMHEEQVGADCQTAGTIAYKSCATCNKNYAADAEAREPFENALESIEGEKGDHVAEKNPDGSDKYTTSANEHWLECATCGEEIVDTRAAHTGDANSNGAAGHSMVCDVCGFESENTEHSFGDDSICDQCDWECEVHNIVDGEVIEKGDCETDRVVAQVCNICGYEAEDKVIEATGHTEGEAQKEIKVDGGCEDETTYDMVVYCSVCDEELSRTAGSTPAPGHNFDNECDTTCDACGEIREVGDHKYTNDADTTCNYCGKTAYPGGNTLVKVSGVYRHVVNRKLVNDTTLVKYNGKYRYIKNGVYTKTTTLFKYNGKYRYIKNGDYTQVTTLFKYNGKYRYIKNGDYTQVTTLFKYNGKYRYIKNGDYTKTTTLFKYNGKYRYIKNGDYTQVTTLFKYNGKYRYIKKGDYTKTTTLFKYNGKYRYIKNGDYTKTTTLFKYNGKYRYIKNGDYTQVTTLVKYNGKYYYVKKGDYTKATTLVKYNGKYYYVKNGVYTKATTRVKYNGKYYNVKNGIKV